MSIFQLLTNDGAQDRILAMTDQVRERTTCSNSIIQKRMYLIKFQDPEPALMLAWLSGRGCIAGIQIPPEMIENIIDQVSPISDFVIKTPQIPLDLSRSSSVPGVHKRSSKSSD